MSPLLTTLWTAAALAQDAPMPATEPPPEEAPAPPSETPEPPPDDGAAPEATPAPPPDTAAQEPPPGPPPSVATPERVEKVATWSLSGEIGSTAYRDDAFDLFSSRDALGVGGLRLGHRVHDRLEAQVGWLRSAHGARVTVGSTDPAQEQTFVAAYDAHRLSMGLRADVTLDNAMFLYVAGRGQLVVQRVRLDGDPSTASNPDQRSVSAVAPGGELLAGFELRIPQQAMPLTVGWTVEAGGELTAPATFRDLGDLRSGGFVIHTGLGLRF